MYGKNEITDETHIIVEQRQNEEILPAVLALLQDKKNLFFVVSEKDNVKTFAYTEHMDLLNKMLDAAMKNEQTLIGVYAVSRLV